MQYAFFFISKEDTKDGTKLGYSYAKSKQNEWVTKSVDVETFTTAGQYGVNFIIHNNKVYNLYKKYLDLDSDKIIILCTESTYGSDTKVF